jgi:hypothetical protein
VRPGIGAEVMRGAVNLQQRGSGRPAGSMAVAAPRPSSIIRGTRNCTWSLRRRQERALRVSYAKPSTRLLIPAFTEEGLLYPYYCPVT